MSLLPHDRLAPAGTPRTHALVIGVSDYQDLDTGVGATFGLDKLESPVPSATAFADFLLNEYDNPSAPLGTVAFLASGGQYKAQNSAAVAVKEPLFKNIKDAFDSWYNLCDQSADNVGIFYFCGHGFDPGPMTLLCQDFGVDQSNIWSQAIDFDTTYWAMGDNKAIAQCYFIDACREKPIETLYSRNFKPTPLRTSATLKGKARAAPTLKAAIDGRKALAPRGSLVSYFTDGLLNSFREFSEVDGNGINCLVTTDSIVQSMLNTMRRTTLENSTATVLCAPFGEYNVVRNLHRISKPLLHVDDLLTAWRVVRDRDFSKIDAGREILQALTARLAGRGALSDKPQPDYQINIIVENIEKIKARKMFENGGKSEMQFWKDGEEVIRRAKLTT
jgi:hypothetical protein